MLARKIKYIDYNGNEREETFHFNLSQAELTVMEMSVNGGLVEKIQRIVEAQDGAEIIKLFQEIILKAYGVKSEDGKQFMKSEQLSNEFSWTEAYSQLFIELCTNADAAAAFVNGIVPPAAAKHLEAQKPALGLK